MADDSELDYIKTFLGECHVTATVNSFSDLKNINLIVGTERIMIYPGEVVNTDGYFYKKRYPVKLSETNEAALMAMVNDIINGCEIYNSTRTGFTSVSVMCNLHVAYSNKFFEHPKTKRWDCDLYLDIEWSTS